jgi:hydroxyacylglutathione hydrolase
MTDSAHARTVDGFTVVVVETPGLGDRSYLVHDGSVAFVVDPQRDVDRFVDLLSACQVRLTHVFETHVHNDYLTGGLVLARRTGAEYVVNGDDTVSFSRTPMRGGDGVAVGRDMEVTALATPGHTFTHLSYVLARRTDAVGGSAAPRSRPVAVFTGGSLLYGATGRPDLAGAEHAQTLGRLQHESARRLASVLPDSAQVFPTHGFGSFCAASQSQSDESTIGLEKRTNPALTCDQETYVRELLAGLGAYPAYYAHMAAMNAEGPGEADLSAPAEADVEGLRRRIEAGEWVVDLRNRTVFASGHVAGTLNFGLDGSFATYLGWLIPWGRPVTLLGETTQDVATAQRELVRIGIDRPAAAAKGAPRDWTDRPLSEFAVATFADLEQVRRHRPVSVLDVRRADEFDAARIDGALNIPIHELPRRLGDVPAGEVWVHCAGGYRASVAASFLDAARLSPVSVDDSFDNAARAGLPVVEGPAR